jgi:uroporphyrinogen-III decarboxylase
VRKALALDVDAVTFGDDFGMQDRPFFSPQVWRRFFKPRYKRLFEPVLRAGKQVFFHCCGYIPDLLPELADLGVRAVWPQLNAFDLADLAHRCRDLGLAVQLHPDRGELMQRSAPDQIRAYMRKLCETFDARNGGSWVYVEIDPGFPFENVQALFDAVQEIRKM